ncbi:MAG TPA: PBP1A family penicillin-binding protein [Candidatus Paceibacterota bacterium]|nr:PBP1A family penicillin-binding protein [Candidatus Paceibacterota bacterium]HMP18985.1 PBP1A family penicillin-binding protein [Candidatus Paceibacterota bacterium]HMP85240.1 PBP1A family penicillin-binding protein [Candidatus Paceibacterota bacterium]
MYKKIKKIIKPWLKIILVAFLFITGGLFIWLASLDLPNLNNFEERRVAQSTKIFDRTGEIILYDVHGDIKRTIVPLEQISDYLKMATISIEDKNFYEHNGIQISAIFRAVITNLSTGDLLGGQGGSTITQQVIKNALLTREKKVSRKIKEWVLAPRLERKLTKNQILEIYLNEIPYGGNVYGAEEAARRFFGKQAKDLSLPEAAYLAALPQAPTFYSPYGNNVEKLEARKNLVIDQMVVAGYITKEEAESAKNSEVEFQKQQQFGIKAPHFVMYVRELLEKEYGKDVVEQGGLRVITTLDWELQQEAEEIVKKYAFINKDRFDAENASIVATDPKSGEILVMVGSRDYFDEQIDGNFNIATTVRQPGSAFKPIVYAEAFNKGYRPETIVFDLQTEFSTACAGGGSCYSPGNYDNIFRGPMSLRDALAQSVNVPAVKVLYLAGIRDSLNLAKRMGIETLTNVDRYGLTLVLGGGEVRPLDMASAYGIFANDGLKYPQNAILKIQDNKEKVLFEKRNELPDRILSENVSRMITDVLSDNVARTPAFGSSSFLFFPNNDVAVKTGTTNDYRDAWIVGYTPNISVSAWAGNNDNRSMEKRVAGFIVAPMWNEFMQIALQKMQHDNFIRPTQLSLDVKPIIGGFWKGETTSVIQDENGEQKVVVTGKGGGIHSILHWVNRSDPLGPMPSNPWSDPQYELWEIPVRNWVSRQNISDNVEITDLNNFQAPKLQIISLSNNNNYLSDSPFVIVVEMSDRRKIVSGEVFVNNQKIGNIDANTNSFMVIPKENQVFSEKNILKVSIKDELGNSFNSEINFGIIN